MREKELLYCINRQCNGTRSEKRVKGPDGPGTLCGGCYFHYFSCKWLLFEKEGGKEFSIVPQDRWRLVRVLEYEQEVAGGRRDLMRPIVERLAKGSGIGWGVGEDGLAWVKCLRCGERGAGWMGPDGGGSLCEGCWGVYAGGEMVLWRREDNKLSVINVGKGKKVVVVGWRKEGDDLDYRNPVVEEYEGEVEVGGVSEAEEEDSRVLRAKSEIVEVIEEDKAQTSGEGRVEVSEEGKIEVIEEDKAEDEEMTVEEVVVEDTRGEGVAKGARVVGEVEEEIVEEGDDAVEIISGIYVKVEHDGELRRSRIGVGLSYRGFRREIRKIAGVNGAYSVAYRDDEGDFVTVGTERDLVEMYHLVRRFRMEPLFLRVKT